MFKFNSYPRDMDEVLEKLDSPVDDLDNQLDTWKAKYKNKEIYLDIDYYYHNYDEKYYYIVLRGKWK